MGPKLNEKYGSTLVPAARFSPRNVNPSFLFSMENWWGVGQTVLESPYPLPLFPFQLIFGSYRTMKFSGIKNPQTITKLAENLGPIGAFFQGTKFSRHVYESC